MRSKLPSAKRMPPARSVKPVVLLPCHALDLTVDAPPPQNVRPLSLVHHMPTIRADSLNLDIKRGLLRIDIKHRQRYRVWARGAASQRHGVARARKPHRHRPPVEAPVVVLAVPGVVTVAVLRRVRLFRAADDLLPVVLVLRKILTVIIANHYGPVLLPVARVRELSVRESLVERIVHVDAAARFRSGTRAQLHPLPGPADGLRSGSAPDDSALAGVHALPRAIRRAAAGARSRGAAGSRVGARDDTRRANRGNARGANRRGRRRATRGNARGANRRGRRRATRGNAPGAFRGLRVRAAAAVAPARGDCQGRAERRRDKKCFPHCQTLSQRQIYY